MKRFLTLSIVFLALMLTVHCSRAVPAAADVTHDYRLKFTGTTGVKVRLLLISKTTSNANPQRQEEVVTLPAQVDFRALRCCAWINTLPNDESGNDGDTCNVDLLKDGSVMAAFEMSLKQQNKQGCPLGDL